MDRKDCLDLMYLRCLWDKHVEIISNMHGSRAQKEDAV